MRKHKTIQGKILEAVRGAPGCHLEDMVMNCSDLSWHAIFLEVDRLSRTGKLLVTSAEQGGYVLDLPKPRSGRAFAGLRVKERDDSASRG